MDITPPKGYGASAQARPAATPPSDPTPAPADSPTEPPRGRFGKESLRSALSTLALFATAFLIAILLNAFVIQSYQVDGESMEPTLQNNDRLVVNKVPRTIARVTGHAHTPHRGDIIIFNQTGLPGLAGQKQLIKRVIGLPGDHIVIKDGRITIYNSAHPNGFNPDTSDGYSLPPGTSTSGNNYPDVTLGAHQLFVCGDNRSNSEDSRYFGPIDESQVVAKLVLRILPLNKAQSF
ncbi:MAG TPA: signal peptidase I [Candidatus Saccharimonadales bacterium]|nr:signal peptidase I [Candidatus Saccharimonadales bacterium]